MIFKASMDTFTKNTTVIISTVIGLIFIFPLFTKDYTYPVFLIFIILGLYVISFALKPLRYKINKNVISIERLVNDVSFNISDIKLIQKVEDLSALSSIRLFGIGGLFGFFGIFWNSKYGRMTYYATKKNDSIMLITNQNKKIVITPDDKDAFLECFLTMKTAAGNQ